MTSMWLDKKRDVTDGLTPRDTTVTGVFVEDSGFGVARVQIPHDGPENVVNVPAAPGVYAPGAIVTVTLSTRGVPLGVTPPLRLPADVPLVGVGDEGAQTLIDRAKVLAGAQWQVQAAGQIESLNTHLADATGRLDNLGAEIIDSGQTLAQRLATISASADGKTRTTAATTAPDGDGESVGDLWFRFADATLAVLVGTWTWTGTEWLPGKAGHEVIGSVDVGTLTVVGEARLKAAVIEMLWADVVRSRKITTDMLLVGSGLNLVPNGAGEMLSGAGWHSSLTWDTTDMPAGLNGSLRSAPGQGTAAASGELFDVQPSTEYLVEIWVKASKPNSRFYAELRDQAGALSTTNAAAPGAPAGPAAGYLLSNIVVPTVWTKYTAVVTTGASTSRLRIGGLYFNHPNGSERTAQVWLAGLRMRARLDASLVVDGGILARHITASEELWAKVATFAEVTAGMIVLGQDARLTPEGLTLYAPVQAGQDPTDWANRTPMLQLTSTGERSVAVGNTAGEVTAALTADGQVLGQSMAVTGEADVGGLLIDGMPLDEVVDLRGARIVTRYDQPGTGGTINGGQWYQIAEFRFTNPFDYPLQLTMMGTSVELYLTGSGIGQVRWYASANGAEPVVGSSYDFQGSKGFTSAAGSLTLGLPPLTVVLEPGVTWRVRPSAVASQPWNIQPDHVTRFVCLSLGRAQADLGGQFVALAPPYLPPTPPPPARRRYTRTYDTTGRRTFTEAGALANSNYVNAAWQGYTPYASPNGGAMKCMFGFPSWTSDLAGADIEKIEVNIGAGHTYAAAGATLYLGYHGATSVASWSRYGGTLAVPIARGQTSKWVTIPLGNAALFKNGTIRGIVFDPGGSRDKNLYAEITGCQVRITYVK